MTPRFVRHLLSATLLLGCLPAALAESGFELKPEQVARLQKYLPKTYAKLATRAPVHVVTLGDSVMAMYGHSPEYGDSLRAYQTIFVQQLADQFFYPGGVRVIKPQGGKPAKLADITGQEITVQNLARPGKLMLHAMQSLTSVAFQNKPDLVLVSFGINDSIANCSLDVYRRSVQEVIAYTQAQGADLMLFGPTLVASDPPEKSLALTRPYADVMREEAQAKGVFFCDLGDLTGIMTVDVPLAPIEKPKKIKKAVDGSPVVAPPLPDSPVKSPVDDQFDTDPDKKAMRLFDYVVQDYRKHFNHGPVVDWLHPDAAFHRVLGRRIFSELLAGPAQSSWKIGTATVTMESGDKCLLSYRLKNDSDQEQTLTLLPLVTAAWTPQNSPTEITLKAGKSGQVAVSYVPSGTPRSAQDTFLRLPMLLVAGGKARIEDVKARITPLTVTWQTGTSFNAEGTVEASALIHNTTEKPLKGKWEATWMGQTWSGQFEAPAQGTAPVKCQVRLPKDAVSIKQKGTLGLIVTTGALSLRFDRELEIMRNLGLEEPIRLHSPGEYGKEKAPVSALPGPRSPGVSLRVDADASALYLTWDIHGLNLQDHPDGSGAFFVETNLDARSYGKRLTPGATDSLRTACAAADGTGTVGSLQPWIFGTGYAMNYDSNAVRTRLTSRPDGVRRFTLTLPRNYLYLHEWAVGNGNSQLGINTTLYLWQSEATTAKGEYVPYALTANGLHPDDAASLGVLELTDKPTRRWTARLY